MIKGSRVDCSGWNNSNKTDWGPLGEHGGFGGKTLW